MIMKKTFGTTCAAAFCLACLSCSASAETVGAMLKGADADRDGTVTRKEIIAFRAKRFQSLDRDGDGSLSSNDIPAFVSMTSRGAELKKLISDFDADANGRVSLEEFVNGPTVLFDRADQNGDGALSPNELRADAAKILD
jgi:Ca2+-binding EF-hand superfamily protein